MVGITTGGEANVVSKNIGLHGLLKKELTDRMFLDCMIHMDTLAVGILPYYFTDISSMVVSIIIKNQFVLLYTR